MREKMYLCIDLKSFYASVECIERGLDALTTNLVVADNSRTEKTICLAVSPSLKSYGIPGRPRLFEVVSRIKEVNRERMSHISTNEFTASSYDYTALKKDLSLEVSYIVAPPRMALYLKYSSKIYEIYLKYVSEEDIHQYSIDEVFIDITKYLDTYNKTPREFAMMIIRDVLSETGVTATAGIGTNLYLAKIAMDILAKRTKADRQGVRIAELDEFSYRKEMWNYSPITDFWRVGKGYGKKLEENGFFTMGDIAKASLNKTGEDKLYEMFGVYAELLIDHAWGWEPCTIKQIKDYKPETNSISMGQVLTEPYDFVKTKLVVREMAELLSLDLVEQGLVTKQLVLTIGYDIDNLKNGKAYKGQITTDRYGRKVPKQSHGTVNLKKDTSSSKEIINAVIRLLDDITDKNLLVRRINLVANKIVDERNSSILINHTQLNLFTDDEKVKKEENNLKKERSMQKTMLTIKKQYGKNAILKGMNLEEGATTLKRNKQIGGHKA